MNSRYLTSEQIGPNETVLDEHFRDLQKNSPGNLETATGWLSFWALLLFAFFSESLFTSNFLAEEAGGPAQPLEGAPPFSPSFGERVGTVGARRQQLHPPDSSCPCTWLATALRSPRCAAARCCRRSPPPLAPDDTILAEAYPPAASAPAEPAHSQLSRRWPQPWS